MWVDRLTAAWVVPRRSLAFGRDRLGWLLGGFVACWLGTVGRCGGVGPAPVPLDREAPWRIANFTQDAGVSRRVVFDVAFEKNGTAWFAVSDGLYRYDGYRWRRCTTAQGLPSSFIRTVTVTRDGAVWVGTDQGAGVYDGAHFDRRGSQQRLAGPNVRRIVETADGALWFCCDRWLEVTAPGGLTRLMDGVFRTYGVADGLPSDHLLDLFEQSNGRLIALTSKGAAVREGQRWLPLTEEGWPAGLLAWTMRESPDGLVFAETGKGTLVLREGRWREARSEGLANNAPLCVTRDGSVIRGVKTGTGTVWFARWNGQAFEKASGEIADQGLSLQVVRQAPDGAIWMVGRGALLRWEYLPGAWEWRPELPPPILEDRQHRLWFADGDGAVLMEGERVQEVPQIRPPLVADARGIVWAAGAGGVVRWTEGRVERVSEASCGVAALQGALVDGVGVAWLYGTDQTGRAAVAGALPGGWRICRSAELDGRRILSACADGLAGLWLMLSDDGPAGYLVARVSPEGTRKWPMDLSPPRPWRPRLCASSTHLYLHAYNGLWEAPLGERLIFSRTETDAGGVFTQAASVQGLAAFVVQEGFDGNAAIVVRRQQEWMRHRVSYGEAMWLGRDGWLMVADGAEFVLWQLREWSLPTYVGLPMETTITSMLRATDGAFWLGTHHGVLHLRPGKAPPDTLLAGPRTVLAGGGLEARATGLAPLAPQARAGRYSFCWRLDGGGWSEYGDWPPNGLPLTGVSDGHHLLEARARDGLGNEDPTPARLPFEVLPIPIQDRRWFRPVLAGLGLAFGGLSLALYGATRRLRRHAGHLETEVQARTAQLREDITRRIRAEEERERMQAQLVQAQKMESVGRLAGGVAHDFNNMLQAILGNVSLALEQKSPSPHLTEHLQEIQKAAQRSADLTRQLLAFARKQTVSPRVLDLNDTVAGMLKMLRRLIGEHILLAWQPGLNLWPVRLDPSQLDQVLANLTVNARDAINGIGQITIATANITFEASLAQADGEGPPGDYVLLSVTDTGQGMDRQTQAHLFEPFFTTKPLGEGTGLGLATVYGIVKQNHGLINVHSQPGAGTTIKIYLPRAEAQPRTGREPVEEPLRRGTETLLWVEDEPAILKLGQAVLEGLGYRVLPASTPAEAIRVAEEHAGSIHLLITDVVLPQMNGRDLAQRLQAACPHLPCLFVSGYTADVMAVNGVLEDALHFVQKPFTRQELAAKVRAALDAPAGT